MTAADQFLAGAIWIALFLLTISFLVTIYRVIVGPTLPDRILALDMLVGIAIGYIAVIGIKTGFDLYVDIAIALGLVGFLATVAFARFVLQRGTLADIEQKIATSIEDETNFTVPVSKPSNKAKSS